MKSFNQKHAKWVAAAVIVVLTAYFIWPTPWIIREDGESRLNRFTGRIQHAGNEGWQYPELDPIVLPSEVERQGPFPLDKLVFTDAKAQLAGPGRPVFEFILENPTSQQLSHSCEIVFYDNNGVEIGTLSTHLELEPGGKKLVRTYRIPLDADRYLKRYDHFRVRPGPDAYGDSTE
ncbi:MAG: hypothetical protein WD716_05715 [Fimbriimonadaceae bacterium]